ncbi:ribonuclease HI family protein [Janthinobacterium fluminis]|uniref:Ribonuclease HI family protein n=1 Tax=Janthinobacterium fluminis TaxID=2987524 RepID=A0ABT5JUY0_9BURK|nr:ribonuclease HI family protein [Janthinobacterium fluminis]MDC8756542.1 ribonuclease HI family protein [Janthinobacterium fluminis]
MPEFEELIAAAHHSERVRARRLARHGAMPERDALRQTLEQAAGTQGLAGLLRERAQERLAEAGRRAAQTARKAEALARKRAGNAAPATAWQAWFDGSAQPNPGRIGIGGLLTSPAGRRIEISRRAGHGSSSEAEYSALIALLEAAVRERPAELLVYGDSRVVIDDVNRVTAPAASLAPQRARADALLARLGQVTLRWIPRHRNAEADRLSQQGAALPDGSDA